MQFHSGFSLQNESYLFDSYIKKSDFSVCGFSYGAIAALNAVLQKLENAERIDTLQFFSPAFFQTKDAGFKRLQLRAYKTKKELYMREFLSACFAPYQHKMIEHKESTIEQLEELLNYEWDGETLRKLEADGVAIEVYLGSKDAIIDAKAAHEFFVKYATVTYIKGANHFLQLN